MRVQPYSERGASMSNYGEERAYLKIYLGRVKKTIAETHILLDAQYLRQGYPHGNNLTLLGHLERLLENNYIIKDGLEMSLIQLDQEEVQA